MKDYKVIITQKSIIGRKSSIFSYIDGTHIRLGDVTKWCQENIKKEWQGGWIANNEFCIMIFNEESAIAFKLRWE